MIFSGIGEDHRMSYAQSKLPFKVIGVDYIEATRQDSMARYARRLGEKLVREGLVDPTKSLFLAGASFGGVIAQELSNAIRCDGVIMISTYRHRNELAKLLQFLGTRVATKLPIAFYHSLRGLSPIVIRAIARLRRYDVMLCSKMFGDFPKRWFREQCRMAASWEGCPIAVPKLRIHGELDPVIPHYAKDVDVLIPGDMHMSLLSNKAMVNAAISEFIAKVMRSKTSG